MMMVHGVLIVTAALAAFATQPSPRIERLINAVRAVLPYPAANADGDLPADNRADARWFVIWPDDADDVQIIVRANPLHPEVQKASVEAMAAINAAVTAAERRAQAAYDRALEQLRKTGKAGALENVSLDDEGIAGERIDADLELTIELAAAEPFELAAGEAPAVSAGANGPSWLVTVPAHAYQTGTGAEQRERFRAAETWLYFGLSTVPTVSRIGRQARYAIGIATAADAFAVRLRGNAELVAALAAGADWNQLVPR
jgi:hypothetical protein